MDLFTFSHISAFSILIPIAVAIVKRKSIRRKYFPLVVLLVAGALNDLVSYFAIRSFGNNTFNSNVYVLIEFVLLVWLFRRWAYRRRNDFLFVVLIMGVFVWILDNCVLHTPFANTSLFWMTGSILMVYICIDRINLVIFNAPNSIIASDVMICIGLLVYHIYKAFLETFQVFPIPMHKALYMNLWVIHCLLSTVINLLFSIAFLCLRSKPISTILSLLR